MIEMSYSRYDIHRLIIVSEFAIMLSITGTITGSITVYQGTGRATIKEVAIAAGVST